MKFSVMASNQRPLRITEVTVGTVPICLSPCRSMLRVGIYAALKPFYPPPLVRLFARTESIQGQHALSSFRGELLTLEKIVAVPQTV
jgi:hypothetical protein